MSDKSFGDHTNRNVVKNPLLSSAVTGVSLEDLTNKAILLPVTPSQGLITRPETKATTLEHHETRSEDQNANPKPQPAKDDFDVNEYFARLQGTRYVSAPANTHLQDNSNLEPPDGLEEINLEPEEQQSLTADIAQNFSQLPNVLPHVASAVFNSFSNMLSYKSKEKVEKEADKDQVKPISDAPWANPVLDDASPPRRPAGAAKKPRTKPKKRYFKIPGLVERRIPIYIYDRPKTKYSSEEVDPATLDKLDKEEYVVFANPDDFYEILDLGITQEQFKSFMERAREMKEMGMLSSDSDSEDDDQELPTSPSVDINGSYFASQIQSGYLPPHSTMPFIPPPPTFSGKCSQSAHMSVLPPSVARRISANQPIIRPQEFVSNIDLDNIFIPTTDYKEEFPDAHPIAKFAYKCLLEAEQMPPRSPSPEEIEELSEPPLSKTYVAPIIEPILHSNTQAFDQKHQSSTFIPMFSSQSTPLTLPIGDSSVKNVEHSSAVISPPPETRKTVESSIPMAIAPPRQETAPTILDPTRPTVNQATANIAPAPAPTFYNPLQYQTTEILRNEALTNISSIATNPARTYYNPLQYQTLTIQSNVEPTTNIGPNATTNQAPPPTFFNPLQYQTPATQIKEVATTNTGPNATTNQAPTFFNPLSYQTPVTQIKDDATTNIGLNTTTNQAPPPTLFNPLQYQTPTTEIKDEPTTNIGPNTTTNQASAPALYNPLQHQTPATQIKDEPTTNIGPNTTTNLTSAPALYNPLQYQTPATESKDETTTNIGTNATTNQAPTFFNPLQYQTSATQIKDEATTNIGPNAPTNQASAPALNNPLQYQTPATQIQDEPTTNIDPNAPTNQASAPALYNPLQYQTPATQIKDKATTNVGPNATTNQATAPTFFNPLQYQTLPTQSKETDLPTDLAKPLIEPPKSTGTSNYRMTKKRPQYYSGPIEGVGAISNNVKPILPPVETGFQSAILAPDQPIVPTQPIEPTIEAPTMMPPFDISQPKYTELEYTTAFDLSRPTTERYEQRQEKQESKGFGLIGSLKSKLSSIDINKIQNTVTTFFDPAYNEPKEEPAKHDTQPNLQQNTGQFSNQSNFEIFVPTLEQPSYNQYDYSNQQASYYGQTSQYYQQNPYYHGQATMPNVYDQSYYNPVSLQTTVQQPIIEPQTAADVKITEEIKTIQGAETSTETHSDLKIDDSSKTESELQTKVESGTTIDTSNIPVEITSSATITDLSAKNFFDSPFVADDSIKNVDTSAKVDLQFGTGDKVDESIKPQTDFTFKETKTDGGEDRVYDGVMSSILGQYYTPENNAISKPVDVFRPDVEDKKPLLTNLEENPISFISNPPSSIIPENFGNVGDKAADIQIRETNLLESLITDAIPIVAVSSVPFFGLSTIIADKTKEPKTDVKPPSLFDPPKDSAERRVSITFYENKAPNKNEKESLNKRLSETDTGLHKNIVNLTTELQNVSLFDLPKDQDKTAKSIFDDYPLVAKVTDDGASELSICETCREVTKHEEKDSEDLTTQLIDNITSPIQLSNPVEATLTEGETTENRNDYDRTQFAEITHITEETIDTINVQSATELLEDDMKEITTGNFGWCNPETYTEKALSDHDYTFKLDPNSIGFFGNNSLFFDNVPNNASDEIKAEFKNSHEDMLSRQVSIPSAPPVEDDTKSDETGGLDVHLIEQDAKKDFPIDEEFIIEPSETDDDKIEYKEREKSEDSVPEMDSFTNRVERFKKMEEVNVETDPSEMFDRKCLFELKPKNSPAISIASYFDTGNYAAETHYRNTLNSPTSNLYGSPNIPMRIPPGFEEEYHRRMSGISLQDKAEIERIIQRDIRYVPETSTQTRHTDTTTYVSSPSEPTEVGFDIKSNLVSLVEDDPTPIPHSPEAAKPDKDKTDIIEPSPVKPLPDPINFFSQPVDDVEAPESFNRLASYFASPKENKSFFDSNQNKSENSTKPHKSFFELSQGQNHYMDRNLSDERLATLNVMRDLTSIQNITVTTEQIVRTVNYFTVEYDKTDKVEIKPSDQVKESIKVSEPIDDNFKALINCKICFKNNLVNIANAKYKVRQSMNDNSEGKRDSDTMEGRKDTRRSVTLNLDNYSLQDDSKDGVTVTHENRSSSDYSPVKYHWFYSVDIDDKSVWRGFSITDSRALEEAYNSPDLNESTLVATDGGRYDVNIVKRTRTAVYWSEKPTDVLRCSWFYKGPTDARYVPYSENVAEKLEEEYHHGMTTGEWHRRLLLPNSELVVMHGPSVMVHFPHGGAADAIASPPATSRPCVVRRGHDESEIEDSEPSSIDHLLLLCHGVGSACDMRFRPVEEVVDDFRATSLQLVQSHYKNSYDNGVVSRVEVLPISWHSTLHSGESGVDRRLAQITLDSMPRLRNFTNDTVLDVLFYTSPVYCQTIIDTVCSELNRIYRLFLSRNPTFKGRVSLGGHSLGSVILYDLLCHQKPESPATPPYKKLVTGSAGPGQPSVKYPTLQFRPAAMYALGSPIAMFECIRGVESLGTDFSLPTCENFFNIFHPYDPIAYRIEPLINPKMRDVKPSLIPHHKGRKRMHLELKDTMSRVGADLKQKLIESLRTTWNKWMSQPPTDGQLEKVVEEEMEKEQLCDENKEEFEKQLSSSLSAGRLNGGRRVDYVLQEAPLELINEYLFAMRSHVGYWMSEDTMLMMLREIYSALGVQPDCTVPQQSMTVQRTTTLKDETIIIDHPSTSRGGT